MPKRQPKVDVGRVHMNRLVLIISVFLLALTTGVDAATPAAKTVFVDCDKGNNDAITKALKTKAVELTIEISGICVEDVEINRTNVIMRGTDPLVDGIRSDPAGLMRQALSLRNVSIVTIENLQLTGASNGISINDSFAVNVVNCRLENNTFAGAIVGTASGSISFSNMVVAAPAPPAGARLIRGILITNGSSASCFNCTIDDYREALLVSTGANLFGNGGTYNATSGALQLGATASAFVRDATFDGRIRMFDHRVATLFNVTQINSPFDNDLCQGSSLIASGATALFGDTNASEFTKVTLNASTSMSGTMTCFSGSDAFCDNPLSVTTGSNCGQCANP
jgi:hypothetical protein